MKTGAAKLVFEFSDDDFKQVTPITVSLSVSPSFQVDTQYMFSEEEKATFYSTPPSTLFAQYGLILKVELEDLSTELKSSKTLMVNSSKKTEAAVLPVDFASRKSFDPDDLKYHPSGKPFPIEDNAAIQIHLRLQQIGDVKLSFTLSDKKG